MEQFKEACTIYEEQFRWFVTQRKKLEEVDFADEEFQHKKINNKDVYMCIMACYRGYSRRCMKSRQFGWTVWNQTLWRFDIIKLK